MGEGTSLRDGAVNPARRSLTRTVGEQIGLGRSTFFSRAEDAQHRVATREDMLEAAHTAVRIVCGTRTTVVVEEHQQKEKNPSNDDNVQRT